MSLLDDLADALAADTMKAMDETGDDRLYLEIGKVIGTSSPSLEEAFLTSCRLRLSEQRGRRFLDKTMKAWREGREA